ncbi:5-oxoprolinase subunit B family protein [Granulicoccus phenolivorans]|uniref:5-oxoprolinase subunit B family protein n=1 Tax=Granulicoccus phenolivorans TaxID=266854 RepID=UPI00040A6444|nr:carboxyltransferase domain-containing protein [Granulicoccus phenolivorans]
MTLPLRLLPCGTGGVLVEITEPDPDRALRAVLALAAAVRRDPLAGDLVDLVPAARTLLLTARPGVAPDRLRQRVVALADRLDPGDPTPPQRTVTIEVEYGGWDLAEVADLTGLSRSEVIHAHTATPWQVAFGGFAPGFAYLIGGDPRLAVPRRTEPRTRVPQGAVGLAGRFSGVYPRESPGGWQVLGVSDVVLWNPDAVPPALLSPGTQVRFRAVSVSRTR